VSEPVQQGEFSRAIGMLSVQVESGNATTRDVLVETKKTNGRVYAVERAVAELMIRLVVLEQNAPLTKRDLWVAVGTLGGALAFVKWFPVLVSLGRVAP